MPRKPNKEVLCDNCGSSNEAKHIYSAQKAFVGRKIVDLLETITQKTLPINLGLKVCFLCASTMMSTVGVIERTQKLVEKFLAMPLKKPRTSGHRKRRTMICWMLSLVIIKKTIL
uniref:Zinc finger protein CG2199-like n=1 Tax=Drosophila rhopaloa TaxID=1041015 RepID=A0A6P4F124_DRORH